jgi:hypothetical protein
MNTISVAYLSELTLSHYVQYDKFMSEAVQKQVKTKTTIKVCRKMILWNVRSRHQLIQDLLVLRVT